MVRTNPGNLFIRVIASLGLCAALFWVVSCSGNSRESDRQIQQQAQQDTVRAKIAAQKAAADARVAAANAERDARAVASGVKEGLHQPTPSEAVDLNSASRAQLEHLPGVGASAARRIAENRPYSTPHDLVRKGVLSQSEYDRIAGDVVTR